jgi:tetratricopeptide (TPR) repeat protein
MENTNYDYFLGPYQGSQQTNKVKWCGLCAAVSLLALMTASARGQAADALIQQANAALKGGQYATAAKDFETIVTTHPETPNIEQITINAGDAYLHAGNYPQAVEVLQKLTSDTAWPEFRGKALFITGLAEFSQAQTVTDPDRRVEAYRRTESTLNSLITFIGQNPANGNSDLAEDAMYYLALSAYGQDKYDQAESDLNNLLAKFGSSLQKPDYLILLGSIYAVQANSALTGKAAAGQARVAAQKAIAAFDQVVNDPNALVQANEANLDKANVLYLIASIDLPATDGYEKALEVYRRVHRKDDMIALQQARIAQLQAVQQQLRNGGTGAGGAGGRLLDRETARLNQLKSEPDPIVQALIRMAECYVAMKQSDEARTILRRLRTVQLTPDQQQDVDFQFLYSYTVGGQAEKADAALDDYLKKHPGDAQADSISVQIAAALVQRGDYPGALAQAQRSLKDFPRGKHVGEAIELESEALTKLGRLDDATKVIDEFIRSNPNNPVAYGLLVTQGEAQIAKGDLNDALISFGKVKDNPAAGIYQAPAAASIVQILNTQNRYDDVIKASQDFQRKFPHDKALAGVAVLGAIAMDKKGDPNAVAALQKVARDNPQNVQVGSIALYYVVMIYQRENQAAKMEQAAKDLASAYPTAYALIAQADDSVVAALEIQKRFDDAAALEQPLTTAPLRDVAALTQNKIGDIWLDAAKAMGSYQSLQTQEARDEAERRMKSAEQGYVATLKNFPDQVDAVGDALKGLVTTGRERVKWGLLKESDLEDYLTKLGADLTAPDIQARLEMAKAGLVFVVRNGHDQDAAALARFDKATAGSPNLTLTTAEADQYGQLLIGAKQYAKALDVYQTLLKNAEPTDQVKLAEGYYGMAATYLAQNDYANAKTWLGRMLSLPNNASWDQHAGDAQVAMAEINEQSATPADQSQAMATYAEVMRSPTASAENQARAMLGYGRLLEKEGHAVKAANQQDIEYATHYYEQVNLFYGKALPELSAQGLYLAGEAAAKAGDTTDAAKDFDLLRSTYKTTAPDWVQKAPTL